jgi:hypothetical protein
LSSPKTSSSTDYAIQAPQEKNKTNNNTSSNNNKNNNARKILKRETDSKCRFCNQFGERAERIPSACPILAK